MSVDRLTLLVEFQVREDEVSRDEWLSVWNRRAMDAFEHESETNAYGAAVALDDPNAVLIFERYEHGESSLHAHMERPAHTELIEEMTARRMTKRRLSGAWLAEVPGCGWWNPPDPGQAPQGGHDLRIAGFTFDSRDATAEAIARTRDETAGIGQRPSGVQILGFGQVSRPDDRNPDLDQGDMVIVRLDDGTDQAPESLWPATIEAQPSFQRHYKTADAGFFWRPEW